MIFIIKMKTIDSVVKYTEFISSSPPFKLMVDIILNIEIFKYYTLYTPKLRGEFDMFSYKIRPMVCTLINEMYFMTSRFTSDFFSFLFFKPSLVTNSITRDILEILGQLISISIVIITKFYPTKPTFPSKATTFYPCRPKNHG